VVVLPRADTFEPVGEKGWCVFRWATDEYGARRIGRLWSSRSGEIAGHARAYVREPQGRGDPCLRIRTRLTTKATRTERQEGAHDASETRGPRAVGVGKTADEVGGRRGASQLAQASGEIAPPPLAASVDDLHVPRIDPATSAVRANELQEGATGSVPAACRKPDRRRRHAPRAGSREVLIVLRKENVSARRSARLSEIL